MTATAPFTGPQATYDVIVNEEMTVTAGAPVIARATATVPVMVTRDGVGVPSQLEATVTYPDGAMRFLQMVATDANGVGAVTFKATSPGQYTVGVEAHGPDGLFGATTTVVTK